MASPTWIPRARVLREDVLGYMVEHDTRPLSFADVLALWREDANFTTLFVDLLAKVPFTAFRFETPPLTSGHLARPFEFVLVDSPDLELPADTETFRSAFEAAPAGSTVTEFDNLGGDARLIAPLPPGSYAHLAAYTRQAPREHQIELWSTVGHALHHRADLRPVWLNTAGGGVAWLHVRLDDRPKYYRWRAYAQAP